jgi:DNA (cytosine-5)-methyltransferase 1
MKLRALDLFCCAGGATRGLQLAGFHVTGVDLVASARYVGDAFIQADALTVPLDGYDFIWASPPCQRYSAFSRGLGVSENHPDLIEPIRQRLLDQGARWAIENVVGAPLREPIQLCGSMFGLGVRRHRRFELDGIYALTVPKCSHKGLAVPVYGNGTPQYYRRALGRNVTIAEKRTAMGIDWMNRDELSEAIPPAYAEFIGKAAMKAIARAA